MGDPPAKTHTAEKKIRFKAYWDGYGDRGSATYDVPYFQVNIQCKKEHVGGQNSLIVVDL